MRNCREIDDAQRVDGHRSRCGFHAAVPKRSACARPLQQCAMTQMRQGLAISAYVMGLMLSSNDDGAGSAGMTTLLITGSGFAGYPYFHTAPLTADEKTEMQQPGEFDGLARVVAGLTRTLTAMAGVVQA